MSFPKQKDVEIPLLTVLDQLGGAAKPKEVCPLITQMFPDLTAKEQEKRLESSPSIRKWHNLVQWVRQKLVQQGEIDGSTWGGLEDHSGWKSPALCLCNLNYRTSNPFRR